MNWVSPMCNRTALGLHSRVSYICSMEGTVIVPTYRRAGRSWVTRNSGVSLIHVLVHTRTELSNTTATQRRTIHHGQPSANRVVRPPFVAVGSR